MGALSEIAAMLRALAVFALIALSGCTTETQAACAERCQKLNSCGGGIGDARADCSRACETVQPPSPTEKCTKADLALQRCQLALSCDEFVANTGCQAERDALLSDCG